MHFSSSIFISTKFPLFTSIPKNLSPNSFSFIYFPITHRLFTKIIDSFISTEKPADEKVVEEVEQDKFKEIVDTFIGTDSSKDDAAEQVATKDVEEPVEEVVEETKLSTVQPLQTEEIVNKFNEIIDSFISTEKPAEEQIEEVEQDKFNEIVEIGRAHV